jgi:hypothetical protein
MGRLTCLIAAGALGGMLLVPAALAGKASQEPPGRAFKRVVGIVGVDGAQGTTGRAVARCPRGSHAISGGWFMTDPEETGLLVFKSRRVRKRGWAIKAIQATADSFDTDLLAFAYCDDDAPRARRASAIRTVPSGETRSAAAECPGRRKAVAGGFSVPVDAEFNEGGFPVESQRIGKKTWRVAAHAPNPEGATLTTYAYCGKRVGRLRERSGSSPIGDIGDYGSARSGRCPKGIGARSGGFSLDDQTDALFSIPLSHRDGRGWRVSVRNFGGSATVLRSFAYCS